MCPVGQEAALTRSAGGVSPFASGLRYPKMTQAGTGKNAGCTWCRSQGGSKATRTQVVGVL